MFKTILICIFLMFKINFGEAMPPQYQIGMNKYFGKEYGTEWIFFPDGDENLHFVNLTEPTYNYRRTSVYNIQYRLYTRKNAENYIILDNIEGTVNETIKEILSNNPVKVLTHGWMSTADRSAVMNIKNAYLKAQDVNVIAVDWSFIAYSYMYPSVAGQTKGVGTEVGKFLKLFAKKYEISGENVHLIGHSLGAHVMGIAAEASQLKVGRITGLDPARPLFEMPFVRPDSEKLDASDASFVDVIHTCGGMLGMESSVGKADFYPNGGAAPQPGCDSLQVMFEACSHSRSHFFFAESITNREAFPSVKCNSWSDYLSNKCKDQGFMGEYVNQELRGKFYLKTNPKPPYGLAF